MFFAAKDKLRKVILSTALSLVCGISHAAPESFVYSGTIIKPDYSPLEASHVVFTLQIFSPNPGDCLLYEEEHVLNMANSGGVFALPAGQGTRSGGNFEDINTLAQVFDNTGPSLNGLSCASGFTYTPAPGDRRRVRITFDDGTGRVALTPTIIHSVPYAQYASSVGGKSAADLLHMSAADNLTQTNLQNLFAGTGYGELLDLANGTSSHYAPMSSNGANQLPLFTTTSPPTSPAAGDFWYDSDTNQIKYYDGAGTQIVGTASSSGTVTDITVGAGLVDGSGNSGTMITTSGTIALPDVGTAGTYYRVTTDGKGRVTGGAIGLAESDIPQLTSVGNGVDGGAITAGTIGGTTAISTSGNIMTSGSVTSNAISTRSQVFYDSDDTNSITINPPATASLTGNYVLTLPATAGSSGQVLRTDGTGALSWVDVNSMPVSQITSGTGEYLSYMPNGVECVDGEILKWVAMSDQWVCGADDNTDAVASVFGRTGVVAATAGDYNAGQITNTPAGSVIATDVQAAINELDTEKQGASTELSGISGLSTTGLVERTAAGTYSTTPVTAAGKALLDDADAAAQRTTLGLGTIAVQDANSVSITGGTIDGTAVGGTTPASGTFTTLSSSGNASIGGTFAVAGDTSFTGNVSVATTKTVGIGVFTTAQESTLISGLVVGDAGKFWYNSDTSSLMYWNGSSAVALGAAGSGMQSLAGDATNNQTLSVENGAAVLAPVWLHDGAGDHRLRFPLASGTGVTHGLISKADYDAFSGKLGSSLTSGQIWVGDGTNMAAPVTPSGDLTVSNTGAFTLANSGVASGTYTSVTVDAKGRVTAASSPTTLLGYGITDAVQNAAGVPSIEAGLDASKPVAGTAGRLYVSTDSFKVYRDNGASWDIVATTNASDISSGTLNSARLADSGVIAGTYTSVTVDGKGRVTSATSPTTVSGYGITDAVTNAGGASSLQAGLNASKPVAGTAGQVYISTDTQEIFRDNGTSWDLIASASDSGGTVTSVGATAPLANTGTTADPVIALTGDVPLANFTDNDTTAGLPLLSGGSAADPAYGQVDISTAVTGTLPIANGGTGATTAAGARTNLGLGEAATYNVGGALNELPSVASALTGGDALVHWNNTSGGLEPFVCTTGQILEYTASGWACAAKPSSTDVAAFHQDGDSFGALATLGTNDAFGLAVETNGAERLRIDTAGYVGIGTTAPSTLLHARSSDNAQMRVESTGSTSSIIFSNSASTGGSERVQNDGDGIGFVSNGGYSLYASGGRVGIGTTAPAASSLLDIASVTAGILIPRMTTLQRDAISTPAAGLQVYNISTNSLNYYNGSSWQALGTAGSGLTSLNSQTGSSQSFGTPGTSGTAPAWSSASDVHTLNIPMASATGVTAGLISKTDYDSFSGKVSSVGVTAPIANTGTATAPVIALTGDVPLANITDNDTTAGLPLLSGGSAADPAYGQVDISTAVAGTLPITNGGTGATTAAGARTNLGLGEAATYNVGGALNELPSVATAFTADALVHWNNTSGGLEPFVCTTGQILEYTASGWACAAKPSSTDTAAFHNNGDSFGALATIGTNDAFGLALETGGVEQMRLTDTGRVGIGTTNPASPFHILVDTAAPRRDDFLISSSAANTAAIALQPHYPSVGFNVIWDQAADLHKNSGYGYSGFLSLSPVDGKFSFLGTSANGTTAADSTVTLNSLMTIQQDGNIGIGTANPGAKLHVSGGLIRTDSDAGTGLRSVAYSDSATPYVLLSRYRGSRSVPGSILAGDTLGSLTANGGVAGFNDIGGATIRVTAAENFTSTSAASNLSIETTGAGTITSAPRMTILHNGNVGVGTAAPHVSSLLEIASSTAGILIPRMTTAQRDAIVTPATGLQVYNTSTNALNYYNGSSWQALGTAGSGLTSLNSQTGSSQSFGTPGTSGTAPAWSSASDVHTLNIPMASATGVTAGLISKTDYDSFSGKVSSVGVTAPIANTGTATAPVIALTGDVPLANITDNDTTAGLPLLSGGSAADPAYGQIDISTAVTGTLPIANGGTGATTAAGARTNLGLGEAATYNVGGALSELPSVATAFTADALVHWNNATGGIEPFVCSLGQYLQYSGTSWSCVSSATDSTAFHNGGDSFGALATLGTNDVFGLALETGGAERVRVNASGSVGIGTMSPVRMLHVTGGQRMDAGTEYSWSGSYSNAWVGITDSVLGVPFMHVGGHTHTDNIRRIGLFADTTHVSNNLGIGTAVPRGAGATTLDIGAPGAMSFMSLGTNGSYLGFNTYWNTGWKYKGNGLGSLIRQGDAGLEFFTAASNSSGTDATAAPVHVMSMTPSGAVGIGTAAPARKLDVNGDISSSSIYTSNWFRSTGNTGWYSQDYGGGWHMTDSSWIRAYGGKNIYTTGSMRADGQFVAYNASPTLYLQDSDHRSAMVHANSNQLYFLRGCGIAATTWCQYNGYWPLQINLENNYATFGGPINAGYLTVRPESATAAEGGQITLDPASGYNALHLDLYQNRFRLHGVYGVGLESHQDTGNLWIRGTLTQASDRRLKTDIRPIERSLENISRLQGVEYHWRDNRGDQTREIGLIAQDVREVFPLAVKEDARGYLSVAYQNLVAPLINAIGEIRQWLFQHDAEIAALKAENAELRSALCDINPRAAICRESSHRPQ